MICRRCQERGFYGGQIGGQFEGPWKWCSCPNAVELRDRLPDLVDTANAERDSLIRKFSKVREYRHKKPAGLQPIMAVAGGEDYHGEF